MWLSKIKLNNFKSYQSAEFEFDAPQNGRNIVLIGAQNGHGKTTLLEAIYLCLYGTEATPHLKRAGIPDKKSYGELLKDALFQEAGKSYYGYQMSVDITLMSRGSDGIDSGIRIERKWHYDADKNYIANDDECAMWKISGGTQEIIADDDCSVLLNQYAVPFDYAPFFFYDGEKIVEQATTAGAGIWLKKGLEGLSGMTLLSDLSEDLRKYVSDRLRNVVGINGKQELDKKQREYDEELKRAQQLNHDKLELEKSHSDLKRLEEQLQNQLGGGADSKSTEELRTYISQAKERIKTLEEQIGLAIKSLPSAMISSDLIISLHKTLLAEEKLLSHQLNKGRGEEKIEEFQRVFSNSPAALEVVGKKTLESAEMRAAIREAWDTLWDSPPKGCADKVTHNYLTIESHRNIQDIISRMTTPQLDLGVLCKEIAQHDDEIQKWQTELNVLTGSNNDELVKNLRKVSEDTKGAAVTLKGKTDAYQQCEIRLMSKEMELKKLQTQIIDAQPDQEKSRRANQVHDLLNNIREKIIKMTLEELGSEATAIHKQLAHDERIARIEILSTGSFKVFAQDGSDMTVGLSAGQTQILIMALVSALARVTHYEAPFVIDTPLARLDSLHRQGLFEHWRGLPQQVILLSQDSEITADIRAQLSNVVQKTYLISAESLPTGGARSLVSENQYFINA